jgi:tRNA 5-methylaminomethyl-2-thiouridine biosynthesis bifunctional protein
LKSYKIEAPQLTWGADGAPRSNQFDDIYFDHESGLDETNYVFLEHNQLKTRWQALASQNKSSSFTIAETGFGTGLNFLCAWQLWQQICQQDKSQLKQSRLHFISVEKYPLNQDTLKNALTMWPSLNTLSDELIAKYPTLCQGLHRIELDHGRIQLSLYFGEAAEGFTSLNANVDAWFLDGFAPSKNPAMWNDELFKQLNRLSHTGTTFSTFTAAGIVRRGLKSAGFDVKKVKGFGHKREMAIGALNEQPLSFSQRQNEAEPWFTNRTTITPDINKVLIVGAGLAGCHTARALANKGIQVDIWDCHQNIAEEASGNAQGMLYPKLASQDSSVNRFYLSSYLYACRLLNQLEQKQGLIWQQTGLEQRATTPNEAIKFEKLIKQGLYPDSVMTAFGDETSDEKAIFWPLSGWASPKKWCQQLVQHKNIHFHPGHRLRALKQTDSTWEASASVNDISDVKTESYSHIVLCTANHKDITDPLLSLPTKAVRGQVSALTLTNPLTLDRVLCQTGYVSPPIDNVLNFGSSYSFDDNNQNVTLSDHQGNLKKLTELIPDFDWLSKGTECAGRVAFRCTVLDHAPIIGPIPNKTSFIDTYKMLSKNAKWKTNEIAENLTGLYINIGHGSRGLISTPLAGEYLASLILQETSVYERQVERCIHPARFMVRELKKAQ